VSRVDPRVAWAIAHMERQTAEKLQIGQLARHVNLSASRFAHLFTAHTGKSPARYLRELRLDRARVLLETTFLSVKEVMAAVGFNDASHFSRDFERSYGMSPRVWRLRVGRPPPRAMTSDTGDVDDQNDLSRELTAGIANE
jgi:AraC family transcriptional regulator, arabinose operon regulatory protein